MAAGLLSLLAAGSPTRVGAQSQAPPAAAQDETSQAERTREFLGLGRKPDPAAAARGATTFRANCAFCHGQDARGAEGPDLLRSQVVLDDDLGEKIGPVIQNGRPSLGMPAFPSFDTAQIHDIAEFLHLQVELAANRGTYRELNIVTGNAQAGAAFFNGKGQCNTCHSVTGDLAGLGAKLPPPVLQRAFLYPPTAGFQPPVRAVVTMPDGKTISGAARHLDDFYIALDDDRGEFHSIPLRPGVKVALHDGLEFHRRMLGRYTDAQMHDLTAYLVTLK
jgi:mono/diheme cytochrome c family protein